MDDPTKPQRLLSRASDYFAEKLSRVTSTGEMIPEIDGLRFIAIGVVLFHHLVSIYLPASLRHDEVRAPQEWFEAGEQSWMILAAYCGHFGVNLFFVISGFILALPFAKRAFNHQPAPGLKSYYLRRVTRLEPPYILSLLVYYFLAVYQGASAAKLAPHLLASSFYLHGMTYGEHSRINGVTWSLEIEIQFYLIVPLLVYIYRLRNTLLRRALMFVAIVFFGWLSQNYVYAYGSPRLQLSLINFIHFFLTGFLLADLYLSGPVKEISKTYLYDVVTLLAGASIIGVLLRFGQYYFLLSILVGLFYAGFYLGKISNKLIRLRWIVIIGGMCYTIYLYHIMIISNLMPHSIQLASKSAPFWLDFFIQAVLISVPLLVICSLIFALTEKPFMKWSLSPRKAEQTRPI